jgi:thiosulfate reductase cytochrome b subunit
MRSRKLRFPIVRESLILLDFHACYNPAMADAAWASTHAAIAASSTPRHAALVRLTHWITALTFLALLVSGFEIVISHPRFYWGETGNVLTKPLFQIPIPASRNMVATGYDYVWQDQNGWSRALHFQSAWLLVFTAAAYMIFGVLTRHFTKNLLPAGFSRRAASAAAYNPLQRLTYLIVIFFLFPLEIWTGLAMSPAFVSAVPATVVLLGGQQSARTVHFFNSFALLLFLIVHIVVIARAGFIHRVRAMIAGRA